MTIAELKPASELQSAAQMARDGSRPFPNESPEYREARTRLLAEEIELRRHIQRVAQTRRALPPGGEAADYRFLDSEGKELSFAELFGRHEILFTYYWMYGPERERPCPMCTSFVGSLDSLAVIASPNASSRSTPGRSRAETPDCAACCSKAFSPPA